MTAAGDGAPLINSPVGYGSGGQHVVFEGGDNQVYYLDWDIDDGWHRTDPTGLAAPGRARLPPTAYWFDAEGSHHVLFVGTDGHVHELWRLGQHSWHYSDRSVTRRVDDEFQ